MSDFRSGKCPVCGIKVENDYGTTACADHRDQVKAKNKEKMAALREKKNGDAPRT
jgi:hypothetical protein